MKNISYLLIAFCLHYSESVFANPKEGIQEERYLVYQVTANSKINARNSTNTFATSASPLLIEENTHIIVLEKTNDIRENTWVHVGLERPHSDDTSESDFWILEKDLMSLPLRQIEDGVLRMTYCYRYVKRYLLEHGIVDEYLPGASAYMAASILPKYGFYKTGRSPSQAIVHDVCVYKGGPSGHGHIEIMTPSGWYYGYGYKSQPIKNRVLISCFHK